MKQANKIIGFLIFNFFIINSIFSFSGGFNNDISDSWATGNGGCVVARAENASTNWYNPAGLTKLEGSQLTATLMSETVYMEFDSDLTGQTIEAEDQQFWVPSIFYSAPLNDSLTLGIGLNSAYGLVTEWDNPITNYVATESCFEPINFNPNIAYVVNDELSVAFGVDIHYAEGSLKKKVNETLLNSTLWFLATGSMDVLMSPDANSTLEGDDIATGWNLALMYTPNDMVSVGFSYRSEVEFTLDGDVTLEGLNGLSALTFGGAAYKVDASLDISIPATTTIGVAFKATDAFTIELDLEYAEWSAIEEFKVKYKGETDLTRLALLNSGNPITKDWDDTLNVGIGMEYRIDDNKSVFMGSRYRPTPIPEKTFDPVLPSSDLFDILGGVSFDLGDGNKLDIHGSYIWGEARDVSNTVGNDVGTSINGKYSLEVYVVGVSYTKQF